MFWIRCLFWLFTYWQTEVSRVKLYRKWPEGKLKLLRVSGRLELSRVWVTEDTITINVWPKQGKSNLVWVSARFELAKVQVMASWLYFYCLTKHMKNRLLVIECINDLPIPNDLQSTPDNLNLQGKWRKVPIFGSREQIRINVKDVMGNKRKQSKAAGEVQLLRTLQVSKRHNEREQGRASATELIGFTFSGLIVSMFWTTVLTVLDRFELSRTDKLELSRVKSYRKWPEVTCRETKTASN